MLHAIDYFLCNFQNILLTQTHTSVKFNALALKRIIILPIALYGCETWSLTLREEHRLRVFENRVVRRIFGPKRDEVMREWRKLHNEELNDLYCSPNIVRVINSRKIIMAEHVTHMGESRCACSVLVG